MAKPNPQVGLIIRYEYLWKSEELDGENQGEKHRPCVIILVVPATNERSAKAMVCALTHSEPRGSDAGIEVPDEGKAQMGLTSKRQWVIASEANLVDWDDPGIVELKTGGWTYGTMVRPVLDAVRVRYRNIYSERGAADSVINRPSVR
jgi:hypothetical protein